MTLSSDNKVSKEAAVKPSRDRASASSKNQNDLEKVVDSNRHDGAVRQEFSGNWPKNKYAKALRVCFCGLCVHFCLT